MKLLKKLLLPCTVGALCFGSLPADEGSTTGPSRDIQAVSDYIDTKRSVSVAEKGGDLKISGDIRSEWAYIHTRSKGEKLRGQSTGKEEKGVGFDRSKSTAPIGTSEFNMEANLTFDYKADRSWSTIRLQMSNSGGLTEVPNPKEKGYTQDRHYMNGSGSVNKLSLRKAFMGYNVWEQGTTRFDVEIGRQRLHEKFDSKIQFNSVFDGILAKYTSSIDGISDFQGSLGAFVVNSSVNHFGYVGEAAFTNIVDSGLDLKYSLIHWDKKGRNGWQKKHPYGVRFINSQITANYTVSPDLVPIKTQVYGAFLRNHLAHKDDIIHQKAANAFYLGCQLGKVERKGDYAVDIAYHYVEAKAISERDISLMGRDNPRKHSLYRYQVHQKTGKDEAGKDKIKHSKEYSKSGGYANYKGYKIDAFYAITDNLTFNVYYQNISHANKKIGGKYHSSEFFLGALYAF